MSPKRARWWKKIRARGLIRFVVVRGILLWACGTFALATLLMFLTDGGRRFLTHNANQPFFAATVIVFGGILWGLFVWYITEWEYRRLVAKNGEPQ